MEKLGGAYSPRSTRTQEVPAPRASFVMPGINQPPRQEQPSIGMVEKQASATTTGSTNTT